ncbi:glutamine amidotransferase [Oscillatoria sp. CS-180]|uniref:glutamine amidotransferase-related protein n=1 Tax=Oscillatoria sp. CS-180 TaxID=3021720 RepID=UPI00232BACAC|nr:glutamine amidotransferase [Oscillatoria sp. CS-180]MDB9525939.1 glutamine amidotransferase [Oscillatoria sp. CS-180]
MSPILVVVHQATSNPGLVGEKLRSRGYHLDIRCPALGDPLPTSLKDYAGAIIFGGPMSANDGATLPFIQTEIDWVAAIALRSGKPYLGICLGAQILAKALQANVMPHPTGQREIGYFDLRPTAAGLPYIPQSMAVYHWHNEGFTLPAEAVQLAEGDTFKNQAFRYGQTAFGLQFHPEITAQLIDEWTTRGGDQLTFPGAQPRESHFHNHKKYGHQVDLWLETFLDAWLNSTALTTQQPA